MIPFLRSEEESVCIAWAIGNERRVFPFDFWVLPRNHILQLHYAYVDSFETLFRRCLRPGTWLARGLVTRYGAVLEEFLIWIHTLNLFPFRAKVMELVVWTQ